MNNEKEYQSKFEEALVTKKEGNLKNVEKDSVKTLAKGKKKDVKFKIAREQYGNFQSQSKGKVYSKKFVSKKGQLLSTPKVSKKDQLLSNQSTTAKKEQEKIAQKKSEQLLNKKHQKKVFKSTQAKKVATKSIGSGSVVMAGQDEDFSSINHFQSSYDASKKAYQGSKKSYEFVTKGQQFSRGITKGKPDKIRFTGKIRNTNGTDSAVTQAFKSQRILNDSSASLGRNAVQRLTNKISKGVATLLSRPSTYFVGAGVLAFLLVIAIFVVIFSSVTSSNAPKASLDGVFYVEHWDGADAYHSDFLAQRYGITAEQIDGFIASQGFKNLDKRASGEEFLKLQDRSGIDVRALVAFGQMESSFGTAGVAKDFPESNIFGYGAFDSNPNNGGSWSNEKAVDDFRQTQIDGYSNRSLYICDLRASAYHSGTLKAGEAVYWTALNAGVERAKIEEAFDKYIDEHGGTPEPPGGYGSVGVGSGVGITALDSKLGTVVAGTFGGLTGECYAVPAYYAHSINPSIILRNGVAAADIWKNYDWKSWGWNVVPTPNLSDVRAGDIITFNRGADMGGWKTSFLYGHTAVVGEVKAGGQLVIYDQASGTPLKTWTYNFIKSGVSSVIHPPSTK